MLEMFKCFLTLSSTFFLTLGINSGNSWMKPKYSTYISSHEAALNTIVDWKLRTEFSQKLLGTSSGSGSSEAEGGGQTLTIGLTSLSFFNFCFSAKSFKWFIWNLIFLDWGTTYQLKLSEIGAHAISNITVPS